MRQIRRVCQVPKKASQKGNMNTTFLKKSDSFFAEYFCNDINASILNPKFDNELKEADIIPAHKKKSKLSDYFEDILSKYQCGFRKGYCA